ncbi:MAG: M23 family metallopeptidase, partial [Nocardioides sp.]
RSVAPETRFQMPFPCGQAWTGTTRDSHSPSRNSIDWNRPDDPDDPVVASAPGVVVRAENTATGYGRWVMLEHASGERSIYAHLEDLHVRLGQSVDQGALLGTVGETGNAYGEHLHFEQRSSTAVLTPYFSGVRFVFGSTLASQNCPDVPLAGNFLGGPAAELVVYRRAAKSTFLVQRPGTTPKVLRFGSATDEPVVGDWDGDGRANPGLRASDRTLFRLRTPAGVTRIPFGAVQDRPVAGDWNGDGTWEIGVRQASGRFVLRAADGTTTAITLGDRDDLPVTGDWDGDRRTDVGVYDQASATFTLRVLDAEGLAWIAQVPFGQPGDLPVAGDWDGNLTTELGVWNPLTATFSERRAASATAARSRTARIRFGNPR